MPKRFNPTQLQQLRHLLSIAQQHLLESADMIQVTISGSQVEADMRRWASYAADIREVLSNQ